MASRRASVSAGYVVLLGLAVAAGGRVGAAEPGEDPPSRAQDLAYGEVLFHYFQDDYLTALTRLLAGQARNEFRAHGADSELMLGGLYLSYGQHRLAGSIFERVLAESVGPGVHDRAWFFLAKIWYQRGYLPEAEAALARIKGALPGALEPERVMLHAQVLMAGRRFDEALAVLETLDGRRRDPAAFAKYNIGVALVRTGRVEAGTRVLDEVGRIESEDPGIVALRDKANVALGYAWLQSESPGAARAPLERVRLTGPFSNKALLGVGWADAEQGRFESALVPWLALRGRNLVDSAVQESLLAVPYAFASLGADRQAADYYVQAIDEFEAEIARIDASIVEIETGGLVAQLLEASQSGSSGWYFRLDEIPASVESRYLYELLATHEFQEALKSYRDLLALTRNLDGWADSLAAFDDILDTKERAYRERLPAVEASLGRMDLEAMNDRRLDLVARLDEIERRGDYVALAPRDAQQLWADFADAEARLGLLGDDARARELRDRHRFLEGLLKWDLEREYKARLWEQTRELRELERVLSEARRRHARVTSARDDWPEQFATLTAHIGRLEPRVDALRSRVDATLVAQREHLERMAVAELDAQRERLATYRVQARFALAALYDRAAQAAGPDPDAVVAGESQ